MDPSGWRIPVLVSNFGQETVMVEPFSEIGMVEVYFLRFPSTRLRALCAQSLNCNLRALV